MATAVDLQEAGVQAWENLTPLAVAGTLRAQLLLFCADIKPLFPESLDAGHPVANWNAVVFAFATDMASTASEWPLLRIAADYIYRMCLMGQVLVTALPTETTAMLASYNARF